MVGGMPSPPSSPLPKASLGGAPARARARAASEGAPKRADVGTWLTNLSKALVVYAPVFEEAGYDDQALLKGLEDQR